MATTIDSDQYVELHFPLAGMDRRTAFAKQPARQIGEQKYARTTPLGENVVAFDFLDRGRGGSRRGLTKYIPARVQDYVMQHLAVIAYRSDDATG